jgi:hypothetical protein
MPQTLHFASGSTTPSIQPKRCSDGPTTGRPLETFIRRAQRPRQRWRHAQPADRERLGESFTQAAGSARVGAVQLAGERFKLALGEERVAVVVGGPHPLGHGRGDRVGEPVGHIPELVKP